MLTSFTRQVVSGAAVLTAVLALSVSAGAASINYGDFSGTTVMYLDIIETANTPGDLPPLFGPPSISGDDLDFDPAGFVASSSNGVSDLTDGQLNFTLMSTPGTAISSFTLTEGGDYSLLGTGTAATQVNYAVSIGSIKVLEVDGVALPSPVALASASASGGDNLGIGTDSLSPWNLSLSYDLNAALQAANVAYLLGATKVEIAINNQLAALSQTGSIASIAKKDFAIDTTSVPEPAGLAMVGLALCGLGRRRR